MKLPEVWIFLFCVGALSLNWPFIELFDLSLPVYLFVVWGVFIITMGWSGRRQHRDDV